MLVHFVTVKLSGMVSVTVDILINAEHFTPMLDQIIKLEEALFNIQYEQHWLEAQTERQSIGKSHHHSWKECLHPIL
jgi:hypothetical protein